jgi:hypothetical protein
MTCEEQHIAIHIPLAVILVAAHAYHFCHHSFSILSVLRISASALHSALDIGRRRVESVLAV